jgi:NAD(P) transhydrogenase
MERFDLFVLGSGPAGQRAAVQAAKLGKRVGVAERSVDPGGVCLMTGTIPSKTLREAVLDLVGRRNQLRDAGVPVSRDGITVEQLLGRCRHVVQREADVIRDQMSRNHITLYNGTARFTSDHHVQVSSPDGTVEVESNYFVIATGSSPENPRGVPVDGETIINSDGILRLGSLPRTMTVVGAGVIGTEYASIFATLGVEVTVIDKRDRLLEFLDREIADALTYQMRDRNVTFRFGEEVESVGVPRPGQAEARLKSGKRIVSDLLLYSIGRRGATGGLDLENAGLSADARGRLEVNERYQTEQPHIYAVGDVIGFPALASTSMEQGRLASCFAFGLPAFSLPNLFPYGIYSIPEISMVGPTEEELTRQAVPYEFGIARYREIARGAILGDDSGVFKILFHRETRKILGVHIIGTGATELVHIGQVALSYDATIDFLIQNVFNYPTFAECYKVAALDGYNKVGPATSSVPPPLDAGFQF